MPFAVMMTLELWLNWQPFLRHFPSEELSRILQGICDLSLRPGGVLERFPLLGLRSGGPDLVLGVSKPSGTYGYGSFLSR